MLTVKQGFFKFIGFLLDSSLLFYVVEKNYFSKNLLFWV